MSEKNKKTVWKKVMPKKKHKKSRTVKGMPIAKKIIKDLTRERTIVFAIFLQLFIILTSSVIMTNANNLFNPEKLIHQPLNLGIAGDQYLRERVVEYFSPLDISVSVYEEKSIALNKFKDNKIDAVLIINRSDDYLPIYVKLIIPKGDVKASMVSSSVKDALQVFENYMRDEYLAEPNAIRLDKVRMKNKSNPLTTQIFEALYSILIPFLLLLPGVLLGGLVIDILIEELETKTLNILMLIVSFRRYLFEIIISITTLSMIQVVLWELLLSLKGIVIANLAHITGTLLSLNLILFIFCILLTLLVKEKTRAQLIYSFIIMLLFASAPLFEMNPIRVISRLAIGLEYVPALIYNLILFLIAGVLFVLMNVAVRKKEW